MRVLFALALLLGSLPAFSQASAPVLDYVMEYSSFGGVFTQPVSLKRMFAPENLGDNTLPSGQHLLTVMTKQTIALPFVTYLLTVNADKKGVLQLTLRFEANSDDETALLVYLKQKMLLSGSVTELSDDGSQEARVRLAGYLTGMAQAGFLKVDQINAQLGASAP